ncbi:PadR family transcriptional regulator [Lacticaseibacillus daqingensis]|uniref:PadR family transcriptional regulator n=1 Tax=Lacticaseibacillus daqingensis TaxID=2486014 RepID=UPI000F79950D|nr:PadR family transcriptional regulator [Lacticaseibacillus daqingensis]
MAQTQLLKGVLEGCVLAILARQESYGYELMQALHDYGFTSVVGGTLYPLLAKLEKQGDLVGRLIPSADGPARRYFHLTPQGQGTLREFEQQWAQLGSQVAAVLAPQEGQDDGAND